MRIREDGPVRVAVEVTRETAGSKFVQTVTLAAGGAGEHVEIGNAIDWNTRASNLKAVFRLTASNQMATYNMGLGTIQRPNAQPKKFEVPTHQWIDLTDAGGSYGITILTDNKLGSDKPRNNTVRLTLLRTPAAPDDYADQATQDAGHHEFTYGISGHAEDWRAGQSDWQAERLNEPLIAFETERHDGALGREFSLLQVSSARVRVMALKQAEGSNEVILRLVELDGKPQQNVRISFATPIATAREVNGQEEALGAATLHDGVLVTSFTAYQPRTFAITLKAAPVQLPAANSRPVSLPFNLAAATGAGAMEAEGFDGQGNSLPAEMVPEKIAFNGVEFQMGAMKTHAANAVVANGQTIQLPEGGFNRIYLLSAAIHGDQDAEFRAGNQKTTLRIEDWSGFIGQWDNRQWKAKQGTKLGGFGHGAEPQMDPYAEMTGIRPGYIKRAELAWYADHHHDAAGRNATYSYAYLFGYAMEIAPGTRTLTLPNNRNIRILAISVASQSPQVKPVQPLYDTLGAEEPIKIAER